MHQFSVTLTQFWIRHDYFTNSCSKSHSFAWWVKNTKQDRILLKLWENVFLLKHTHTLVLSFQYYMTFLCFTLFFVWNLSSDQVSTTALSGNTQETQMFLASDHHRPQKPQLCKQIHSQIWIQICLWASRQIGSPRLRKYRQKPKYSFTLILCKMQNILRPWRAGCYLRVNLLRRPSTQSSRRQISAEQHACKSSRASEEQLWWSQDGFSQPVRSWC